MEQIKISMSQIGNITVIVSSLDRDKYDLNPSYQRESGVWSLKKRRLLIDSIFNQYDVPKIYLHEFEEPKKLEGINKYYSVIDGKQRLETIWKFIDNEFSLAKDFEFINDPEINLKGLLYKDIAEKYPKIHAKFNSFVLTVIGVKTKDTDLIDDMFSRMNESVPLNAPEKRNAKSGPIPLKLKELVERPFFKKQLPIENKRYKHLDLACKFMFLEQKGGPAGTSKSYLDNFVEEFSDNDVSKTEADNLFKKTIVVVEKMEAIFGANDELLSNLGTDVVYYLLIRDAMKNNYLNKVDRAKLEKFDQALEANRNLAEEDSDKENDELSEFINLHQSPNSVSTMKYKMDILKKYLEV